MQHNMPLIISSLFAWELVICKLSFSNNLSFSLHLKKKKTKNLWFKIFVLLGLVLVNDISYNKQKESRAAEKGMLSSRTHTDPRVDTQNRLLWLFIVTDYRCVVVSYFAPIKTISFLIISFKRPVV